MKPAIAAAFLLVSSMPAYAGNEACWGDNSQTNISCHELGERFLMSMRGATQAEVRRAMGVDGRGGAGGSLSFMSLYTTERRGGGGTVIFHFDERGRIVTFDAFVEHANSVGREMEMIWSPTFYCSDFPGSKKRCGE